MVDEAAIIWLEVLKANGWGENREVDLILTYTNTQLGVEWRITDVPNNYHMFSFKWLHAVKHTEEVNDEPTCYA